MYVCMRSGTTDQPTRAHAFGIPADFVGANDMIEEWAWDRYLISLTIDRSFQARGKLKLCPVLVWNAFHNL